MEKDDKRKTIPKYRSPLGAEERLMMLGITGLQEPLNYPRIPMKMADGQSYEEYVIPEEDRRKVFEMLYLFDNAPAMDDMMLDLHSETKFKVSEYKAIRQNGANFLVAPRYAEFGGTLLDWGPAEIRTTKGKKRAVCILVRVSKQKEDAE